MKKNKNTTLYILKKALDDSYQRGGGNGLLVGRKIEKSYIIRLISKLPSNATKKDVINIIKQNNERK